MAFSNIKFSQVKEKYALLEYEANLFPNLQLLNPSVRLIEILDESSQLPLNSEKAKSEFIVAPILLEVWRNSGKKFSIFSGVTLDVDVELRGECDFILSQAPKSREIESPIFTLIQAKDDNIRLGIGQCVLQMYAAQKFNELKNKPIKVIYGCVTTGDDWQFLKLEKNIVTFDNKRFYLSEVDKILGVFQLIVNQLD